MTDRSSRLLTWMQLVRLPNVFTAIADVAMGYLVTHPRSDQPGVLAILIGASSCLYMAGMVLNDVLDVEVDRRERSSRPIPSGRVSLPVAKRLGAILLALGVAAGLAVTVSTRDWRPIVVSLVLAGLIVAYDAVLKHTPLGPPAMGGCRALNVLLGMSITSMPWTQALLIVPLGIGLYIAGVTWFSRGEAAISRRVALAGSFVIMFAGIALLWWFPRVTPAENLSPLLRQRPENWTILWLLLTAVIGWRAVRAIADPRPAMVQVVVKAGIFSLIVFDAALVLAVCGLVPSLAILSLLIPTLVTGWWVYST